MTLADGDNAIKGDAFTYIEFNNIKNCWSMSDPRSNIVSPQIGMLVHDTDDDKWYICSGLGPTTWVDLVTSNIIDITVTAGQNLSIRDCVYCNLSGAIGTAGRAYKADADLASRSSTGWIIGFCKEAILQGNTGSVRIMGIMTGFTGLTIGGVYYVSAIAGTITATEPGNSKIVGVAFSATTLLIDTRGPNDTSVVYAYNWGYFMGGKNGGESAVAGKLTYSNDTTTACTSANLSQARHWLSAISKKDVDGYILGGNTTGAAEVVTTDKVTYSSDTTAACTSADLPVATGRMGDVSEGSSKGYVAGGFNGGIHDEAYKTTYGTDSTAACTSANLSAGRYDLSGLSEGNIKGYFAGGDTGAIVATADKITFGTDSTAACTSADLSIARSYLSALSGTSSKGYFTGGNTTGAAEVVTTDKITYGSDSTVACTSADLSAARGRMGQTNEGSSKGYVAGGFNGGTRDIADKVTFGTDSTAACTSADLTVARYDLTGLSGSSV